MAVTVVADGVQAAYSLRPEWVAERGIGGLSEEVSDGGYSTVEPVGAEVPKQAGAVAVVVAMAVEVIDVGADGWLAIA